MQFITLSASYPNRDHKGADQGIRSLTVAVRLATPSAIMKHYISGLCLNGLLADGIGIAEFLNG